MKKVIRLTESDLTRIVNRVLNENKNLLVEGSAKSLSRSALQNTYKKYNDMGPKATFDETFKKEREKGLKPFADFVNSCATKVSLALNAAGQSLKPTFVATSGPFKGKGINTSAAGLKNELVSKWGEPDVKIDSVKSLDEVQKKIGPGKIGVYICTPCGFGAGASGHATIWTWWKNDNKGGPLDGTKYPENNGGTIYFWQVGDTNIEVAKACGYQNWDQYKKSGFKCK